MKFLRTALLSVCLLGCTNVMASFSDQSFEQNQMIITDDSNKILILSAFENEDIVTSYSYFGNQEWQFTLESKVISWNVKRNRLYIFSKSRDLEVTYLHSLNLENGTVDWVR